MKLRALLPLLGFAVFAWSCDDADTHDGESTPIDSTNINGTAPATYGADNPDNMNSPRYEGRDDSTAAANTMSAADSMRDINKGNGSR
jgi:hypothetical protein